MEVFARKSLDFCEWSVRVILLRAQKKRRAVEKASVSLETV
mgnify:CR=1 FL=1